MGLYRSSKYKDVRQTRDRSSEATQIESVLQLINPQTEEATWCAGL